MLQLSAAFDNVNGADAVETAYDGFGRLISSTNTMGGWDKTLSYTYDKNSNRTQLTHDDGNSFAYDYDGLNRNIRIREGASGRNGTQLTYQTYTARGTMSYMLKGKDFNPGNRTIYTYDTVGRMTRVRHYLNKQNIGDGATFTFGYNPAGQIKSRTINNDAYAETAHYDVERDYTVNGLNQYTGTSSGGTPSAAFTYDDNGNLTSDESVTFI